MLSVDGACIRRIDAGSGGGSGNGEDPASVCMIASALDSVTSYRLFSTMSTMSIIPRVYLYFRLDLDGGADQWVCPKTAMPRSSLDFFSF